MILACTVTDKSQAKIHIPNELNPNVPVRVKELMEAEKEKQKEYNTLSPFSRRHHMLSRWEDMEIRGRNISKELKWSDFRRNTRHLIQSGKKFDPDPYFNIVCLSDHTKRITPSTSNLPLTPPLTLLAIGEL